MAHKKDKRCTDCGSEGERMREKEREEKPKRMHKLIAASVAGATAEEFRVPGPRSWIMGKGKGMRAGREQQDTHTHTHTHAHL